VSNIIQIIIGAAGGVLAALLIWLVNRWEGAVFLGTAIFSIALWWFHRNKYVRFVFNLLAPATVAILWVLLPSRLYSEWVSCAVPWLPQPDPPCLIDRARREVFSVISEGAAHGQTWYQSSEPDGKSEIVARFNDVFTGEQEFLISQSILRTFWKNGHLIARDERSYKTLGIAYSWMRTYYNNGCVVGADYLDNNNMSVGVAWDYTCKGDLNPTKPGLHIPMPMALFLPVRY
jgi:hypothetical protein